MNIRRVISILKRSRVYYRCIRQKLSEQSIRENFHEVDVQIVDTRKLEYEVVSKGPQRNHISGRGTSVYAMRERICTTE